MNSLRNNMSRMSSGAKLLLLLLCCLIGWIVLGGIALMMIPLLFGSPVADIPYHLSDSESVLGRQMILWLQGMSSAGLFIGGAWLHSYLTEAGQSPWRLWISQNVRYHIYLIIPGIIILLGIMPTVSFLEELNQGISFPEWLAGFREFLEMQQSLMEDQLRQLTHFKTSGDFIIATIVMALIPAIGEEWIFRGKVQVLLQRITNGPHLGIWISSLLFALIHQQFFTLLPMFFLSLYLGYLFAYTGSLWLSTAVHFANNFASLLAVHYYGWDGVAEQEIPQWTYIASATLVLGLIVLVIFNRKFLKVST